MKDTNTDAVLVSAKDKAGINLLIEKIEKKLNTITNHDQNEHITSLRQEQLLIKINKDFGQSIILTTHNPDIASIGDRQFILDNGSLHE